MNFVKTSLKYRQVTLTVLIMVFAVGIYSLLTMPRREDPKITNPLGLIIAFYPGATAAQVEEQVTKKIEQYLFQFDEVMKSKTYSTSRDGIAIVNIWLNDNVKKPDIFWNKLKHQMLITKAIDLPQGVQGPIVNSDFGDTEAMLISLEGDEASHSQLNDYAKILEDNLRTIKATSKVKRIGEQNEQITVYFNSDKLSQVGIGLQQVVKVLQSQNSVNPSGEIQTGENNVSYYTSGSYKNKSEIENQIVGTSKTGQVVRLGDISKITREYAEPTTYLNVNGHKSLLVAIQVNEGNNIVWFGKDVNKTLANVTKLLPSNVKMTTIVNQPKMVDDNISRFMREFLIAIISVIVVILLMLPFRVAAVAATAIPMTISITFALMHTFAIELHQVSLAALIVVLGMVVDDAIVVADNYVELLDKGVERWTAAWRSAFDLIVPILTATITIIASFMPMVIIPGAMGEFIHDLPVTVTIALISSFVVAMFLTPTLCFFFIKRGLNDHSDEITTTNKKSSVLDYMQKGYNLAIEWCTKNSALTINGSLITIILAIVLFKFGVREKFMPYAERNQFVVELWMPTGTKLDKTQQAILRVENFIKKDKRVVSYATFAGMSAPRVYYNFSPELPISNYAQILINTNSNQSTETLANELSTQIDSLIPEGMPQVKLMQQGQPTPAPVEVRIYGDDISKMKEIGNQVKEIIKKTKGNYLVHNDFREDFYGVDIQLKEDASRLGFTTTSISQFVFTGFKGYPVSKMYEGDKAVDIVLQLANKDRQTTQDIENMYIESPVTGANVPLRQIAEIKPTWQTGRIMHRNGMRCLTIRSETMESILPSELLGQIRPQIAELQIPNGYKIEYGGEVANQQEVMGHLIIALMISIVLIFLILLFQFRNLKETGIVMLTIPLSLLGAVFGLYITGNNFGFTAFVGLISLSGIVVRNAIILIDYINELLEKGLDIRTAAIESGKRRMRPIFLTAMAAAIGVLPMIISGSSLWSPLASVLAFGITWSMLMALLTVPVLYIVSIKPSDLKMKEKQNKSNENRPTDNLKLESAVNVNVTKFLAVLTVLVLIAPNLTAQQTTGKLDLKQATEMALTNNHFLKIKQLQVNEKQQKVNEDKVKFFPMVSVEGNDLVNQNIPELTISQGSFGALPMGNSQVSLPDADKVFEMGAKNTYNASAMVYQPVSQLLKINAGVQISKTDLAITKTEQAKVAMQIKQAVEKLYYGLLIIQKQKEECGIKLSLVKAKLYDVEGAVIAGKATESAKIGLNASVANEEQNLLKLNIQYDDFAADLKNLIGLPQSAILELDSISDDSLIVETLPVATISSTVQSGNTDLKIAMLVKSKAEFVLKASKLSYLPDLGIMGGYAYQKGNNLYPKNNTFIGVSMKWNIQDMASNTFVKRQRVFMREQAEENIANTQEQVNTDVAKAYRKLSQSADLITVARKVVNFRREDMKIQSDKQASGLNIKTEYLTTKADLAKSEADLFAAQLGYKIAFTELQIILGKY